MGKKSRKRKQYLVSRQAGLVARPTEGPAVGAAAPPRPAAAVPEKRAAATAPRAVQAVPDFGHVREDLRRVGLLGAGLVIFLVVLALVIG